MKKEKKKSPYSAVLHNYYIFPQICFFLMFLFIYLAYFYFLPKRAVLLSGRG